MPDFSGDEDKLLDSCQCWSRHQVAKAKSSQIDPELEANMEQYRKKDASYIELIAKAILELPGQKLRLHDL